MFFCCTPGQAQDVPVTEGENVSQKETEPKEEPAEKPIAVKQDTVGEVEEIPKDEEPQATDAEEMPEPQPGEEFKVTIDKTPAKLQFGISLYKNPPELSGVILFRKEDGLMAHKGIKVGDRILEVNGKRGSVSFEAMQNELMSNDVQIVHLTMKRPKMYTLNVAKGEKGLGLSLRRAKAEDFLMIEAIGAGAVQDLMSKYDDREVRIWDCIKKVNDVEDSSNAMLEEIQNPSDGLDVLKLELFRWHGKQELVKLLKAKEAAAARAKKRGS